MCGLVIFTYRLQLKANDAIIVTLLSNVLDNMCFLDRGGELGYFRIA